MLCIGLAAALPIVPLIIPLIVIPQTPKALKYLESVQDIHKIFMRSDKDQIRKGVTKTRAC